MDSFSTAHCYLADGNFVTSARKQTPQHTLITTERFESRSIGDHQSGALDRYELPVFELAQGSSDRFAARADESSDLFVAQGKSDSCASFGGLSLDGPFQQDPGKLLWRRCGEADSAQPFASSQVRRAQLADYLGVCFGVFGNEAQKVAPAHENDLAGMESFRCPLVWIARYRGHQAEDFPRPGNFQDERLPRAGTDGEFYLARTEHKYTARVLLFDEENYARRIYSGRFHGRKIFHRGGGQLAEESTPL